MNKTVLPPPIDTFEELQHQRERLSRLKIVENGLRYDKVKNTEKLAFFLADNTGLSEKYALKEIDMYQNMNLLRVNPDGTLEATQAFPYFMQRLRRNITIAEKTERIMSPFGYFQKRFYGEDKH